jgi:HlyD family secretion protein
MKNKKIAIVAILAAVVLIAVFLFILTQRENAAKELSLFGNVDVRDVALGFRVAGRVDALRFQEGDHIKKGDVLAVLDKAPYQAALLMAEGQMESAAANFAKMQHGSREQEIQAAQAAVNQRQALSDNAERLIKRMSNLYTRGAASQQQRDDAAAAYDSAKAELKNANEALALAKEGFRTEDIQLAQANLKTSQAQLQQAKISLQDTEIIAPEGGNILTRIREPGAIVSAGSPVFDVALEDPVWVRTYVTEPDLGKVFPGQKVLVVTDSRPKQPYQGHIGFISPQAEFTPKNVETASLRTDLVYRIRVVVNNPDKGLRQGMPVSVKVLLGDQKAGR